MCIIKFKLTSLASSSKDQKYMIWWGNPFLLYSVVKYNVLDTKGEGVGRVSPSHGGDFLEIWVLNTVLFGCIIKLKLTSTLAPKKPPNVYDFSTRGGGTDFVVR